MRRRSSQRNPSSQNADALSWIASDLRLLAVPITEIRPAQRNARMHGAENLAAIVASLRRYGQRKPIVVNRSGGEIEAGNAVFEAARQIGWTHLAVVWVEDDPTTALGFSVADNRTAELAGWDNTILTELLEDLEQSEPDLYAGLLLTDLRNKALAQRGVVNAGLCDPDDVPAPPDQAVTQPGDLWILGPHRLLCGDSGSPEHLDRLLAGAAIHLVNTDPPYNVKVEPRSNNAIAAGNSSFVNYHHQGLDLALHPEKSKPTGRKLRAKDRPLANDFVSDEKFEQMLLAWFGNLARVLAPGRSFYIWGGYANCANYPPALKAAKLYFSQAVIWVKEHPVLTRKDFMGNHEWCFYGWREGAAHKFFGPKNAVDVWSIKKVSPQRMVHLTEKPVDLALRALEYSSRPGENVLDLFGGSGSTLIAAEQTGRTAYLMELDPLYCDVIVKRFEQFTGRSAERQPAQPLRAAA
ncbi:MAG: DNA modification methylase [Planctomycetota bacterium]